MSETKVRLGEPAQLAAAVPAMLGFVPGPRNAVVVFAAGSLVQLTARADLPEDDDGWDRLAAELAGAGERLDVDTAHVVGWETVPADTDRLADALADANPLLHVGRRLTVVGELVHDSTTGQWGPLPEDLLVRPVMVAHTGAQVRGSRDELAALVAHTPGVALSDTQADVAWRLARPDDRDRLIGSLCDATPAELVERLDVYAALARALPDDDRRAAALCLVALCAWLGGDGALARVALEECAPDYRLGMLLHAALNRGLTPDGLRGLVRAVVA